MSKSKKTTSDVKGKNELKDLVAKLDKKLKASHKSLSREVSALTSQLEKLKDENNANTAEAIKKLEKKYKKQLSEQAKSFEQQLLNMAKKHKAEIKKLETSLHEQTSASKKDVAQTPQKAPKTAPKVTSKVAPKQTPKPTPKRVPKSKSKAVLLDVKGIGPATAGKLNGVGIKTLDDLINASKETLDKFSALRGADTWVAQAKSLKLA